MRTPPRRALLLVASSALLLVPALARAQSAADKAAAQALFDDAQKAAAAGDWASACPKYAESNRLDPGIGVKLYLADCYERIGRTASAWEMFAEAEEYAHRDNDPRAAVAKQREDRLAPRLVQLVVTVPPGARATGLAVHRDGEDVGSAQWGIPVPVDPGPHTVAAAAPGKQPWSTTVETKEGQGTVRVEVPALKDAPPPSVASTSATAPATASSTSGGAPPLTDTPPPGDAATHRHATQRTAALVLGGAGIVGIAIGSAFGLSAKSKLDQSNAGHCHADNFCDASGVQLRSDAQSAALGSTIAFTVGLAALAGGAVLWLTAPKAATTVGLAPVVTDRYGGLALHGGF